MDTDLLPKKRGRPRKTATSETAPAERATVATRQASTASARKTTTAKTKPTKAKASKASETTPKSQGTGADEAGPNKEARTSETKQTTAPSIARSQRSVGGTKGTQSSSPTAGALATSASRRDSKILQKLVEKDATASEKTPASQVFEAFSEPTEESSLLSTRSVSQPQPSTSHSRKFSPSAHAISQSANADAPPSLKQMNAYAVNSLSQRAHPSRPSPKVGQAQGSRGPKYRSVARRVTTLMVALPIVGVTSWVLYERMVLGREPKSLIPGTPKIAED